MDIKKFEGFGAGFRPKNSGDGRMYNPDRDIAYIMPILMQLTTNSFYEEGEAHKELEQLIENQRYEMDGEIKSPDMDFDKDLQEELEHFGELCVAIGRDFCENFMRGKRSFTEAFSDSGLDKFPKPMVDLWFKHFGHTVMSAFYYGYRDILEKGKEDPMPYDRVFDTAEEIRKGLQG